MTWKRSQVRVLYRPLPSRNPHKTALQHASSVVLRLSTTCLTRRLWFSKVLNPNALRLIISISAWKPSDWRRGAPAPIFVCLSRESPHPLGIGSKKANANAGVRGEPRTGKSNRGKRDSNHRTHRGQISCQRQARLGRDRLPPDEPLPALARLQKGLARERA